MSFIAVLILGQQFVGIGVNLVPSGPTLTMEDDFSDDIDEWSARGASFQCNHSSGELVLDASFPGMCWYDDSGSPAAKPGGGTQPLTRDQWALFEYGGNAKDHHGPSLRTKSGSSVPSTSEFNFVARCSSNDLLIRVCSEDRQCQTMNFSSNAICGIEASGDLIAIAVSAETTDTELCAWFWDTGDSQPTPGDPLSFGNADVCVSEDGSIDDPKLSAIAGTPTLNEDWDTNSNQCGGAPTACKGYPAIGQTDIGVYSGVTGTGAWEKVYGGDL